MLLSFRLALFPLLGGGGGGGAAVVVIIIIIIIERVLLSFSPVER